MKFMKRVGFATASFVIYLSMFSSASAAPPGSPYAPGETLSPSCAPGDTNCTVSAAARAGANLDITSLSGLTTPLSPGFGGTGLSASPALGAIPVGTGSGYIFTATSSLGLLASSSLDTSAKLLALLVDETGSGVAVFGTSPTLSSTTLSGNTLLQSASSTSLYTGSLSIASLSGLLKTTSGQVAAAAAGTDYVANALGDWGGTLNSHTGNYYLDAANLTNFGGPLYSFLQATTSNALPEGANNLYWTNTRFDSRLAGTTTLPNLTTLGNLANATSTNLAVYTRAVFGGTATSSFTSSGALTLGGIGTNMVLAANASGVVSASSTPSVAAILATSSTATSTFAGSVSAGGVLTVYASGGRIGISSSTPWKTFSLNGSIAVSGLGSVTGLSGNALCLNGSGTGEVLLNGAVSCLLSSRRYKHDIATSTAGLDMVLKLHPVTFYFNADTENTNQQYGFIAEEVAEVDPRLVDLDASGTPKTVRYEEYTSVLTRAIQDLVHGLEISVESARGSFDEVFTRRVNTDELCVGTTCISAEEFSAMVAASQIQNGGPPLPPPPPAPEPEPQVEPEAESAATTTDAVEEVEAPAPETE